MKIKSIMQIWNTALVNNTFEPIQTSSKVVGSILHKTHNIAVHSISSYILF